MDALRSPGPPQYSNSCYVLSHPPAIPPPPSDNSGKCGSPYALRKPRTQIHSSWGAQSAFLQNVLSCRRRLNQHPGITSYLSRCLAAPAGPVRAVIWLSLVWRFCCAASTPHALARAPGAGRMRVPRCAYSRPATRLCVDLPFCSAAGIRNGLPSLNFWRGHRIATRAFTVLFLRAPGWDAYWQCCAARCVCCYLRTPPAAVAAARLYFCLPCAVAEVQLPPPTMTNEARNTARGADCVLSVI